MPRSTSVRARRRAPCRLAVQALEVRVVPAFALTIDGGTSAAVTNANITADTTTVPGTTIFSPTAAGAVLDVDAIKAALVAGNVLITTGAAGTGTGNITWGFSNTFDNLDFFDVVATPRTLIFRPDASSTTGNVTLGVLHLNFSDNVDLSIDSTEPAANGAVIFQAGVQISSARSVTVLAGSGPITLPPAGLLACISGDLTLSGGTMTVPGNCDLLADSGDIVIAAPTTIAPGASFTAISGQTVVISAPIDGPGNADIEGSSVTIDSSVGSTSALNSLTVQAGLANVSAATISASVISLGTGALLANNGFTLAGAVHLTTDVLFAIDSGTRPLVFAGPVDGAHPLRVHGDIVQFQQPIGALTALTEVDLIAGKFEGPTTIRATVVFVGELSFADAEFGAGVGTVTGDVVVEARGTLAPAGTSTVGDLVIDGSLIFNGGKYLFDLGPTSDRIVVSGAGRQVNLNSGILEGTGFLPVAGPVHIIDFNGTLTGAFSNAPIGASLVVSEDVIRVTAYDGTGVTIDRATGALGNMATGSDADGTGFSIKLTGPGELVVAKDRFGRPIVVTRETTVQSNLTIATKANASDDRLGLGAVSIHGALGSFRGPKVTLDDTLTASGTVRSLGIDQVFTNISLGGTAADRTAVTGNYLAGNFHTAGILSRIVSRGTETMNIAAAAIGTIKAQLINGEIVALGAIGSITTMDDLDTDITARSVGTIRAGGSLGSFSQWSVTDGIGSIVAASIAFLRLNARFLGTLSVPGNPLKGASGNITLSTFTLSGDDGTAAKFGLKSMTVAGTVRDSTFNVQQGNVGTVKVGRFIRGNLLLNYTAAGAFNTAATFDSATAFKLTMFTTTAVSLADPSSPNSFAFEGSEIAADTIGTVRLTGLLTTNFGIAFGIKSRSAGGSIQVKTVDLIDPELPVNKNLQPLPTALANDFFLLDV